MFEDAEAEGILFTSIGVTTEDAGAVQSLLTWGARLQDRVDYLIVLNEQQNPRSDFKYWNAEPKVAEFKKIFSPTVMTMDSRIQEFQAELRNQSGTPLRSFSHRLTDGGYFHTGIGRRNAA